MNEPANDDNESVHSDDSNLSITTQKEKLEYLINMELKHSGVYYDLHWKNSLLKVDLENLCNSCQRFESQKKKKSEFLEELHDTLSEIQKRNKTQLKEKMSLVAQKLTETNNLFFEAFEDYSSDALDNFINYLNVETAKIEKNLRKKKEELNTFQLKITDSLMKSKPSETSAMEKAINMLLECSMKRPEIEIEETAIKLENEIKKLEQKRQELRSTLQKPDK